jgi:uncharacterized protein with HEPN domain
MARRSSVSLIADIIKSGEKIGSYTLGQTFEQFVRDSKTVDAVIRNFQVIGEASNRLPSKFKSKHSTIEWKKIRAFRNRIVHHYAEADRAVWEAKQTFLPRMLETLKQLK